MNCLLLDIDVVVGNIDTLAVDVDCFATLLGKSISETII